MTLAVARPVPAIGAFLSVALATLVFGPGSLLSWTWLRGAGLLFGVIQLFVLTRVTTASRFSPTR